MYKKEGKNSFSRYMKEIENHHLEKVGKDMRKMMWRGSARSLAFNY